MSLCIAGSVLLVAVAACGGGSGEPTPPPPTSAVPTSITPKTPPPQPPISRADYQKALSEVEAALAPGFAAIGGAQTPTDLEGALSAVALNLDIQADNLEKLKAPQAVATPNLDLVAGMRALSNDLSTVAGDAGKQILCTGGSGLPRAVSGNGAHLFRLAVLGVATAEPDHPYAFGGFLPPGSPDQNRRPANGNLGGGRHGGYGQLTVEAGSGADAVVKLMQGGELVRAIFVAEGGTATVTGIPNGTYEAFYTTGHDWDDANRRFTRDCEFDRFDDPLEFTTRSLPDSIEYTTWTLTLYTTAGGNAATSPVDPGTFPGS
ncbi:hypothetical protein I6A84_26870 [Frankia sp. CNm7]|uniref:Uncharacterized protein n=1 Tax=Frankia nepalensis TaxID=1836974 RepID=A0A937UQE8_9ACTN|nr:hypothetical protein [Frankia nepalensis]MBL7496603.1 hypothetical protein [Frankia nepalensis]MBL7513346.1 hypothetical protein [Frankia nepalensis]MBL7521605.1 hypothetical protein [Frankia nepalensis]MBL7626611.1 hypothetical protein [Frankia nepalensis]